MTSFHIILLLVCICVGIVILLWISTRTGARALAKTRREHIIALTYIRDAAEFRTVDDFAELFLAQGAEAAAARTPAFRRFREEWIAAESAGDRD